MEEGERVAEKIPKGPEGQLDDDEGVEENGFGEGGGGAQEGLIAARAGADHEAAGEAVGDAHEELGGRIALPVWT